MKYFSLDTHIDKTGILAVRTNQSKPAEEPAKKPVKRILQ